MDKKTKLIEYIFESFKNSRKKNSPDIYESFCNYFKKYYEKRINDYIDDDYVIYSIIEELEKLFELSDKDIQKKIVFDAPFEEMLTTRKQILNLCIANKKKNINELIVKEFDNYLLKLGELKEKVFSFNKEEALKIYADSVLDINYIKNSEIETKSTELARIIN